MDIGIASLEAGDNCAFFRAQRDYEAAMLRKTNWVIFAVVVVTAGSLIGLIVAVAVGATAAAAATGVGTVVSGTAMKFVRDQRVEHQGRIDRWVAAIDEADCPPVSAP